MEPSCTLVLTRACHLFLSWARWIQSTFPHYILKIQPNIILPSTPMSSVWSLPLGFCDRNFICISHLILLNLITLIIFYDACKLCSSLFCSLLHPPITSSLLGQNICSTLLNTFNLYSSLSMRACGQIVV
jgi:hypothetical protein